MYFGKKLVKKIYSLLGTLYLGKDIELQGGTKYASAIKYFLAIDEFKKGNGKVFDTRNQEDKIKFLKCVGNVVQLSEKSSKGVFHTKNFSQSFGYEEDFKIGSNFYSAGFVDDSLKAHDMKQLSPKKNPLLSALNGVVDVADNAYSIFEKEYLNSSIRNNAILFLWLSRFISFSSIENIYKESLEYLKRTYTTDLINCLHWETAELKSMVVSILENPDLEKNPILIQESDLLSKNKKDENIEIVPDLPFPHNRIIFGAPGTGKSHKLNDESSLFETNKERVTFHPNYSYAQFVGTYKPVKKINTDTRKEEISYEYVPGPFMRTFVKAYFDSKKYISNCNALIEDAKKEDTNVKYYIAPCNISDWNYFEKINHINQIESWRNPPNGIKEGDVIFIYIGTTGLREFNDSREPGVYAIATALSKPYEASGVRARVDLKFIDIALKNPLYTEEEIKEQNPNNRIQNFQEFSYGKDLIRNNDATLKKFKPLNFLLLIEEINRANVAAVFGDVFQLLDRDENGNSEYPVAASEDIKKYLAKNGIHEDEMKIPSNMYIWATMNSADQGVFPMDTAFKRRWEFEYIGIDENEDKVKGYEIPISATKKVNWNELRKAINNKLITLGINEDKLLGPFFLSKTVLDSALNKGMDFVKLFESKVLMYLFEDAAKMKAKQLFNVDEKKFIYSEVCKKFEEIGVKVFKFNDEDVVEEHDISSKEDAVPTDGKLF